jgi:hypothetical protein
MRLITTDSPLYHRRLVREVKACLGVNGPGAYTEVDGIEKRVWAIRLSNGRVVVQVDDHGTRECRDATHGRFHNGHGLPIVPSMVAP